MKAAMMFRKEVIPPQVGIPQKLGKFASLERAQVLIPGEMVPFSRQAIGRKRNIIVNNFDAAVCIARIISFCSVLTDL